MNSETVVFTLYFADGSTTKTTKTVVTNGNDGMIEWVTVQYAEVNNCGCTADVNGVRIAIAGNVPQ